MRISPLNLISTPAPVLNTLGLDLRVGLSSEDPMVVRHASESYQAYLSVYSPEGLLMSRQHLGEVPPNRRRFFDVSEMTRQVVPAMDHLTVVHRVPSRLLQDVSRPEDEIELPDELDYSMFRSLVEYSYPKGGNGSVIYETPPGLNARVGEGKSSNTLTFTCQMVVSEQLNTHLVLINYSTNPGYSQIARYGYAIHALSGERVVTDHVDIGPFAIRVLDVAHVIPEDILARCTDPQDDLATFTLTGYSEDAAIMVVVLNTAPSLGAVALEHTHPPQSYLFPVDLGYHRQAKNDAQKAWNSIMSRNAGG